MKKRFKDYIYLARPYQYTKNLFVFLPAFFAFRLDSFGIWINGIQAFFAFSFVASSAYVLNDWLDRREDQNHPGKKDRPLASGRINKRDAFVLLLILLAAGMTIGYFISLNIVGILGIYFLMNVIYSIKLKHIPLIDISIIAIGFVLRLLVGALATGTPLSQWIVVITFLLALYLALAKRRDDLKLFNESGKRSRKVIDGYNLQFLNTMMIMSAAIVIISYIMWSVSPEVIDRLNSENVYLSSIFVLIGILRYQQLTFVREESGDPSEILLNDSFIQIVLVAWIGFFALMLYL